MPGVDRIGFSRLFHQSPPWIFKSYAALSNRLFANGLFFAILCQLGHAYLFSFDDVGDSGFAAHILSLAT